MFTWTEWVSSCRGKFWVPARRCPVLCDESLNAKWSSFTLVWDTATLLTTLSRHQKESAWVGPFFPLEGSHGILKSLSRREKWDKRVEGRLSSNPVVLSVLGQLFFTGMMRIMTWQRHLLLMSELSVHPGINQVMRNLISLGNWPMTKVYLLTRRCWSSVKLENLLWKVPAG